MKKKTKQAGPAAWLRENKWTCAVLAAALVLLIVGRLLAAPARVEAGQPEERADYESAVVEQVLSDSTEKDPAADNGYRGEQLLLVTVKSGDYQGQQMQVYNYVGPLYGGPLHAGDRATILISSYSDGTVNATVYEFDRLIPLAIVVALFIAAAVIVGGRTGAKSLVALAVTLVCLFGVLQLRQTGTPIGLRGLLVGGIIISALGAVMDVTMGIASSLAEVHAANPQLSRRELFRSGMNIGRDMVGTMTNTLILAFLGSGFTLILYLYSLGLSFRQLMSSAYVSMEVVSGVASSVGVILSIPLTALITAAVFTREKQQS